MLQTNPRRSQPLILDYIRWLLIHSQVNQVLQMLLRFPVTAMRVNYMRYKQPAAVRIGLPIVTMYTLCAEVNFFSSQAQSSNLEIEFLFHCHYLKLTLAALIHLIYASGYLKIFFMSQ